MSERAAERMLRGQTATETAMLNGWTVGTVVRGHESWGPDGYGVWTTWRITAIGEECVLAKTIRRDYTGADREPDLHETWEHSVTFDCREWTRVTPPTTTEDPA